MPLVDALLLDPAPFQVWIAVRTDSVKGSGTIADPYDGSTATKFDGILNLFQSQSNVAIHLGPGEFQTSGYGGAGGWTARPGMRIVGSGIDVTTLKLLPGTSQVHYFAIGHALGTPVDTFEVSDLTIDCNVGPSVTGACGGVRVMGNHVRIRRVKVKNWGTKTASVPCFALSVITAYPDTGPGDVPNAGIEGCYAVQPYNPSNGPATALNIGSQHDIAFTKEGHGKGPFIRNCFVDCGVTTPSPSGNYRAVSAAWCRGGVVESNQIWNADMGGPYQDQRSVRDLIVRNNFYKNVARGPYLNLGQLGSSLGSGTNNFSRSGTVGTITGISVTNLAVGDRVRLVTSPGDYTGVYQVRTLQQSPAQFTVTTANAGATPVSVSSVQRILSVGRAIIEGNVIELVAGVTGVIAVHVEDNNGTNLYAEPPDYFHGDVIIRNNKIRYVDGVTPTGTNDVAIQTIGARTVNVLNNIVDSANATPARNQRCGAVKYFNNLSPSGGLIRGYSLDNQTKYSELATDAEDAFILGMMERQ